MNFWEVDIRQMGYLGCILICFEAILGVKINLSKSDFWCGDGG